MGFGGRKDHSKYAGACLVTVAKASEVDYAWRIRYAGKEVFD